MRALTLILALVALTLANMTAVMAQRVYTPEVPPTYRGSSAPVVNPNTFQDSEYVSRSDTQWGKQLHKLGRGVVNLLTGWLEIPKNIAKVWRDTDPFTGAVVGGIEGFGWAIGRTATGVYDIFTFPIPIPANYEPLMQPEYITPRIWGATVPGFAGDYHR